MVLKTLVVACLFVALATCQTASDCSSTEFNFYNGYGLGSYFTEHHWDWYGNGFSDGTDDAFDDYFYTYFVINNETYSLGNYYQNPMNFSCDVGTTDVTSASFASYTYDIGGLIELKREFYAPRSTSWIRILDTIRSMGSDDLTVSVSYFGDLGSDSATTFEERNEFFWVSSDRGDGDPALSVHAGSIGGQAPISVLNFDESEVTYQDILIPAGESRSIMTILGQHDNASMALESARVVNAINEEVYANLTSVTSILNWGFCHIAFEVVNPPTTYCYNPILLTFTGSNVQPATTATVNGASVSFSGNTFSTVVNNGANQVNYNTQILDCAAGSTSLTFALPEANLTLSVDNSGNLPSVTATGGYGDYKYSWDISSSDLEAVFGSTVTVTVTDSKGCTASSEVSVPELGGTPTVSGASRFVASVIGLAALVLAF